MKYSIGDFSKLTNLGVHTLRYYEHEHLITPKRDSSNRRCYTDKDLAWINFIKRLKNTGMSIKEIQHYAELRTKIAEISRQVNPLAAPALDDNWILLPPSGIKFVQCGVCSIF